jgi:purine-binding chemotaxis protein CheW
MHTTDTAAAAQGMELFGSFHLGQDEFALPAICIREVVNFPDKITALPLAPPFLAGMFTLRGAVIPVVNLARIFDPEAPGADPAHKIAILDYQQVLVGILFHSTGEILRVRPDQRSTLSYADGEKRGVVAGTILLDDGDRLLQVLDPEALVSIENVPQVLALQAAARKKDQRHLQAVGQRRQCVSFRAGQSLFAFEMGAIQEIIAVPELQPSILNSKLCLGRINFRGHPVAVVDFATMLAGGAPSKSAADPAGRAFLAGERIMVVRIADTTIGFLVDTVDSIVSYFSDELMPIPLLSKARAGMFAGCVNKPGTDEEVILLNHAEILSQQEIKDMRSGHDNLYPDAAKRPAAATAKPAQRQVYLAFSLENVFAVEIKQVREIIDYTDHMARPPGLPHFMRGMLNLRQQMISVIDLRQLYAMPPMADASQAKILVIERGDERYGLLVDGVQNILTINASQRFTAPKMLRVQVSEHDVRNEMPDVIDLEHNGQRHTLTVFEVDRLLERLAHELPAIAA